MSGRFMGEFGKSFSSISRLFRGPKEPIAALPEIRASPVEPSISTTTMSPSISAAPGRHQRRWNVGLDFGTAYTKCIVRNLATQEAFLVPLHEAECLLPTEVFCGSNHMWLYGDEAREESLARVLHLKMVLADVSSGRRDSHWIEEFIRSTASSNEGVVAGYVEALTVYFLARVIQRARAFILNRAPDFSEVSGDRLMVNMAVPVAHAQEAGVSSSFQRCLSWAFLLARESDMSRLTTAEIQAALIKIGEPPKQGIGCHLYPEVSANVQSYLKSGAVAPGLYLFMDVGAGKVDISIFSHHPQENKDRPLTYHSASVIPLGSSQIELRVARKLNGSRTETITELQEAAQRAKEGCSGYDETIGREIRVVTSEIEDEMFDQVASALSRSRDRIPPPQWTGLKMFVGGEGAETPLYWNAVNRWFARSGLFIPEVRPIPVPAGLRWPIEIPEDLRGRFYRRFAVAYGLSFDPVELEAHRLPEEMTQPPMEPKTSPLSQVSKPQGG